MTIVYTKDTNFGLNKCHKHHGQKSFFFKKIGNDTIITATKNTCILCKLDGNKSHRNAFNRKPVKMVLAFSRAWKPHHCIPRTNMTNLCNLYFSVWLAIIVLRGWGKIGHATQHLVKSACVPTIIKLL